MPANAQPLLDEEAGASDNRLTLSVGDHPEIEQWEDGKEYVFHMVRVRQQTPGEFMVLSAEPGEASEGPEGETEPEEEGENMPRGRGRGGYDKSAPAPVTGNPAIDRMMRD